MVAESVGSVSAGFSMSGLEGLSHQVCEDVAQAGNKSQYWTQEDVYVWCVWINQRKTQLHHHIVIHITFKAILKLYVFLAFIFVIRAGNITVNISRISTAVWWRIHTA